MPLSEEQVSALLGMVVSTKPDAMDCDGCFQHLAEFAEFELAGRAIPDALRTIETHMVQCPCCQDEFNALLAALRAIQND